jgi:hypothetical protein
MSDVRSHVSSLEVASIGAIADSGNPNQKPIERHSRKGIAVFGIVAVAIMLLTGIASVLAEHHIDPLQVTLTHGALIVNTPYSSAIIDSHGVAIAVAPLACGADDIDGIWCDLASGMDANN